MELSALTVYFSTCSCFLLFIASQSRLFLWMLDVFLNIHICIYMYNVHIRTFEKHQPSFKMNQLPIIQSICTKKFVDILALPLLFKKYPIQLFLSKFGGKDALCHSTLNQISITYNFGVVSAIACLPHLRHYDSVQQ